ncbi:hypothetical protein EVAR_5657_1 [Eumeta japonica]|uniref:Uncharacterized protein n=1 Tax=Eumeta variegata TaxID=151549 RepID=A0A4C1T7F0_EUMVA|nr:hypothetical protein EVAR_5657_1 [Eumeta japonica]
MAAFFTKRTCHLRGLVSSVTFFSLHCAGVPSHDVFVSYGGACTSNIPRWLNTGLKGYRIATVVINALSTSGPELISKAERAFGQLTLHSYPMTSNTHAPSQLTPVFSIDHRKIDAFENGRAAL